MDRLRNGSLSAGWAEVDITPPLGIPLGGRCVPPVICDTILDRQIAQAIVLRDACGGGAVIVSLDVPGVTPSLTKRVRDAVADRLGCDPAAIIVNASHTHSGPETIWECYPTDEPEPQIITRYMEELATRVIACIERAAAALAPVEARWHEGVTRIAINRRRRQPDGTITHDPNPHGPIDPVLNVIDLRGQGERRAVLFSCACHTVAVYGAMPTAASADFACTARDALRRALGPGLHAQFCQGFAGDVRPRILADLERGVFRPMRPGELEAIGQELARDVTVALQRPGDALRGPLIAAESVMSVMGQTPIETTYLKTLLDHSSQAVVHHADWWLRRVASGATDDPAQPWPVGLLQLDAQHWIAHMAGEPVTGLRAIVESACGGRAVAAWGYSQDYITYLPVDAMLDEGGYEVDLCNIFRKQWPLRMARGIERTVAQAFGALATAVEG